MREPSRRRRHRGANRRWKSLEVATPPVPFSGRGNCLAATQLRPANDDERYLQRRCQAREFVGRISANLKRYGLGAVVTHDLVSLYSTEPSHASRHRDVFALSHREHLLQFLALNLRSGLLALFPPNSCEGFPKIGVDAARVTKGMIEDRFHWCPQAVVVPYDRFL